MQPVMSVCKIAGLSLQSSFLWLGFNYIAGFVMWFYFLLWMDVTSIMFVLCIVYYFALCIIIYYLSLCFILHYVLCIIYRFVLCITYYFVLCSKLQHNFISGRLSACQIFNKLLNCISGALAIFIIRSLIIPSFITTMLINLKYSHFQPFRNDGIARH